jgi:hypothetical protein
MRTDFAVFVLSHGRAKSLKTINSLLSRGYTGRWYIIVDDEDDQISLYQQNFGEDHIIVFDKKEVGKTFDIMDNFEGRQVPTFARNAVYDIADNLGLKYFYEADDDLVCFRARLLDSEGVLRTVYFNDMDKVFSAYLDYMDNAERIDVLAFGQTGDLIGGSGSKLFIKGYIRKAMQGFIVRVSSRITYVGRFNDDVNAYVDAGKIGYLFITYKDVIMDTIETQKSKGGITENYKKYGTYVKSFYSVILDPSCVFISTMGFGNYRIHHQIDWEKAVPKIISSDFKKGEAE